MHDASLPDPKEQGEFIDQENRELAEKEKEKKVTPGSGLDSETSILAIKFMQDLQDLGVKNSMLIYQNPFLGFDHQILMGSGHWKRGAAENLIDRLKAAEVLKRG